MSGITTHVLDTASGRPAQGVGIILFRQLRGGEGAAPAGKDNGSGGRSGTPGGKGEAPGGQDEWQEMASGRTDADGRLRDLLPKGAGVERGVYKLRFATKEYFAALRGEAASAPAAQSMGAQPAVTLYPWIEIIFEIAGDEHYHVPLLLSPFGYSTYRGS
jgi:5-hydroxyisourate hydrolase